MKHTVSARLRISGRVPGVAYRASTRAEARRLGVRGWVRNCPGGSVEALLEGDRDAVEELIAWCRRGPHHARVDAVDVTWHDEIEGHVGFEIAF